MVKHFAVWYDPEDETFTVCRENANTQELQLSEKAYVIFCITTDTFGMAQQTFNLYYCNFFLQVNEK